MGRELQIGTPISPRKKACACVAAERADRIGSSCPRELRGLILGGRSTVGHVALDHVIGVRIPASQPPSLARRLARLVAARPVLPTFRDTLRYACREKSKAERILLTAWNPYKRHQTCEHGPHAWNRSEIRLRSAERNRTQSPIQRGRNRDPAQHRPDSPNAHSSGCRTGSRTFIVNRD